MAEFFFTQQAIIVHLSRNVGWNSCFPITEESVLEIFIVCLVGAPTSVLIICAAFYCFCQTSMEMERWRRRKAERIADSEQKVKVQWNPHGPQLLKPDIVQYIFDWRMMFYGRHNSAEYLIQWVLLSNTKVIVYIILRLVFANDQFFCSWEHFF